MANIGNEEIYLNPTEILMLYPDLAMKLNWTTIDLGHMLKCFILEGYYDRKKRTAMIKKTSLDRLILYVNDNLDSRKVRASN